MLTCIENVLSQEELSELRQLASSQPLEDGKRTAGYRARAVKHNLQLAPEAKYKRRLNDIIGSALRRNSAFRTAAFPRRLSPVLLSLYENGMHYGAHVDDALMGRGDKIRSDVSTTVFLSDPADYVGGELLVSMGFGEVAVKLPAGAAVVYSSTSLHRVAEVSEGQRLAAVLWTESHIRDPGQRELLFDLHRVKEHMHQVDEHGEETALAFKTYSNLLRMWAET